MVQNRDLIQAGTAILVLVVAAVLLGGEQTAKPVINSRAFRIAFFPNLTHAPAIVGFRNGIFQKDLNGFSVQPTVVNAGPEAMEAMLAGAVDAAYVGPCPAIDTYFQSGGKALKVVAGACLGGASLIARSGVRVSHVADLSGKRVAVPQIGGTQDVSLRHFLSLEGLSPREKGGTVDILPAKNPEILTLMKQGQVDAAWVPEPWASRLVADIGATRALDERDLWPTRQFATTILVVRTALAERHPEVVESLIRANSEAIDWLNRDPSEGRKLVNRELKRLSGKALSDGMIASAWNRLAFSREIEVHSLTDFAAAARDAGYLKPSAVSLDGIYYRSNRSRLP